MSVASLAFAVSACGGAANTNTNAAANKPANTANTANTAANTANTANTNAGAAVAEGDTIKIDEAGIVMIVPKGFKHSKDGVDTIVMSEDEGVDIRFTVPKDGDYNKVVSDAAEELDSYLNDIKIEDQGSKVDVNGMEGTSMSGTAKDSDGEVVMWDLTIINAPKKPILVNIYAEKTSMEKHAAEVQAFLKSVKKQ
ncbi:MAG: hypothetical protein JWN60_300 [Acidobacteria bacterium]|nr:hypothetical protein [Acidobacteriota bacterium]